MVKRVAGRIHISVHQHIVFQMLPQVSKRMLVLIVYAQVLGKGSGAKRDQQVQFMMVVIVSGHWCLWLEVD
jgi:hypothetical protein